MSIRLSDAAAQLKVTLSSALTIGASQPYIMSFCARLRSDLNTDAMLAALVDVDPNSTISRRVWSDPGPTPDGIFVDTSSGGAGPHLPTVDVWYGFYYYRLAAGTCGFKVYPDTSSTTPGTDSSNTGDTGALAGLDTIIVGDIEPSSRRACDMEITNLKVQTGVDGWDDTRCRYELDHFAFQSADGTERFAWEFEDIDADSHGLNERSGSGNNFAVIAGTVANGSTRPSQLEAAPGGGGSAVPVFFHQLQEQGIA